MTMCEIWVGHVRDPNFDWDAGRDDMAWLRNIQVLLVLDNAGCSALHRIAAARRDGASGRTLDWGAAMLDEVSKEAIAEFFGGRELVLRREPPRDDEIVRSTVGSIGELPEGTYALVALDTASELPTD